MIQAIIILPEANEGAIARELNCVCFLKGIQELKHSNKTTKTIRAPGRVLVSRWPIVRHITQHVYIKRYKNIIDENEFWVCVADLTTFAVFGILMMLYYAMWKETKWRNICVI